MVKVMKVVSHKENFLLRCKLWNLGASNRIGSVFYINNHVNVYILLGC